MILITSRSGLLDFITHGSVAPKSLEGKEKVETEQLPIKWEVVPASPQLNSELCKGNISFGG